MPAPSFPAERRRIAEIAERIAAVRAVLVTNSEPPAEAPPGDWFEYLSELKRIQGNSDNALAFISTMMARDYLARKLPIPPFDAAAKPQGASGLDIDVETVQGERVVGEIKTTAPYNGRRLGAQQLHTWRKDFDKLNQAVAEHKFIFATDPMAFTIVQELYAPRIPGVIAVLLTTGEEFACPDPPAETLP